MAKNIVIFQDVISKIPVLKRELGALGVNALVATGGNDALQIASKYEINGAILGAWMPQLPGVDTFKKIKELHPAALITIVRKNPQDPIPEEFLVENTGVVFDLHFVQKKLGELYIPYFNGNLQDYLKKDLTTPDTSDRRDASRVSTQGSIEFVWEEKKHRARILNLSRTGILIQTPTSMEVGSAFMVAAKTPTGEALLLEAQVVRVKEEDPQKPLYAVGARFTNVEAHHAAKLDMWVSSQRFFVNDLADNQPNEEVEDQSNSYQAQPMDHAGDLKFLHNQAPIEVTVVSLHSAWMIFDCTQTLAVGSAIQTKWNINSERELTLDLEISKVQVKPDKSFRVGAKYKFENEAQKIFLAEWIAYFSHEFARDGVTIEPKFIQSFLKLDPKQAREYVLAVLPDPRLRFVGFLSTYEREAFDNFEPVDLAFQKLVTLRTQLGLLHDYLPMILPNFKEQGEGFVARVGAFLAQVDALDREVDEEVRKAVASDNPNLRQALNSSSNRLHGALVKLLMRIEEKVAKALPDNAVIKDVVERCLRIKQSNKGVDSVKYDAKEKPADKLDEPAKPWITFKVSKKVKWGISISLVVFVVSIILKASSGVVSLAKLDLGIDVIRARIVEDGLTVSCQLNQWERLRIEDKMHIIDEIEKFMTLNKLKQFKLFDEQGKVLATAAVIQRPVGKPPVYSRRIPKVKSF